MTAAASSRKNMTAGRMLVRRQGPAVIGINRRGLIAGLPAAISEAALVLPVDFLIDGEAVDPARF